MNTTGVLDDYLEQLLGDATSHVESHPAPGSAGPRPADAGTAQEDAGHGPALPAEAEHEPTWDDLPDEVIYETGAAETAHPGDDAALQAAFDNAVPTAAAEREPTWDDLPDEVIYETGATDPVHPGDDAALQAAFDNAVPTAAAGSAGPRPADADTAQEAAGHGPALPAEAEREPTWDDLPDEVIYETGAADTVHPGDDAALQAAFDNAVPAAAAEREPTWDDLPDEVIHETATVGSAGPCPADAGTAQEAAGHGPALPAEAAREPTWDDLPDEVIYETHEGESAVLTNADSPALEAAFSAAATPAAAAPTPPAPAARATPVVEPIAPSARAATPPAQATTWQELQAQAHRAPQSPHMNRRANERSSRWLRLRCGSQAYALELLKVQEVVLPVPLLPLRGTANAMLGIMNLRGQVVPVMDLGLHLGGAAAEDDAQTRIVVLEENGEIMGLRVSAVEDVTNLADSQIEPPDTARICRISNDVFRGVARLQQRPMILLDATRLLN